nr:Zeta toxin PezT [Clostridium botulinum]AIW54778.1 Zeta toxin PezT [Clostridium botulinum]
MQDLKDNGYKIHLLYVGLESKELAAKRVEDRVKLGGHNIPKELIYQRYDKSLNNLNLAMKIADAIKIYDNSKDKKRETVFIAENNKILYKSKEIPNWFKDTLNNYINSIHKEKPSLDDIINQAKKECVSINKNKESNINRNFDREK